MKSRLTLIVFLFLCIVRYTNGQGFKIINSDNNSILVEFSLSNIDTTTIEIDGKKYLSLNSFETINDPSLQSGQPDLKISSANFGVPKEFGNTIQVIDKYSEEISGKVLPIPTYTNENGIIGASYAKTEIYNKKIENELISFGRFGLIRDLNVQSVIIHPFEFNPLTSKIKIYKKIVFRINFAQHNSSDYTEIDDYQLMNSVINYNLAKNWGIRESFKLKKELKNSVLANGQWYRFTLSEEGIYRINRNDLSKFGINADNVDPRTIKIYNNGGYMLPEKLSVVATDDLVENAIYINGESDGKFDSNDYILFYGRSNNFFEFDKSKNQISRFKNRYSNKNYYWITFGGENGKRIEEVQNITSSADYTKNTSRAFAFHDEDIFNLMKSGTLSVGEEFSTSNTSNTFTTQLSERISGSEIRYKINFVSNTHSRLNLTVTENNNTIISSYLRSAPNDYSVGSENLLYSTYSGVTTDNISLLKFNYSVVKPADKGYLDYFEIEYNRNLKAHDDNLFIFSDDTTATVKYEASNFSNSDNYVFDVSEYNNVKLISNPNISGGTVSFTSTEVSNSISKYLICNKSKFLSVADGNIEKSINSNIHGISDGADLLLIGHKSLKDAIDRFVDHKRSKKNPVSVEVVYIDELFNEFSSGMLDPRAIRNCIRYAYENWNNTPKWVLLFGDGEYDYLNFEGSNKNLIPANETDASLNELVSYPFDDFYAQVSGNDYLSDVGIGRLPVNNLNDANTVVDKIIAYETNDDRSVWRSTVTLVADDAFTSTNFEGSLHVGQSESLSRDRIPGYIIQNKIYLSLFPTIQSALGRRKPAVNSAIIDAVNNGTLILNYIGHGSPEIWAHEVVFDKSTSIPLLNNENYFFLTAATCDFGIWDRPNSNSASETMLIKPNSGAIGAFTAARVVYSNQNDNLNRAFYRALLQTKDENGLPLTLGSAFMMSKNTASPNYRNTNDEKFHLFGDPSMRLNIPKNPVSIDSVNGKNLTSSVQIKALESVKLEGQFNNPTGLPINMNGEGIVSVFDSEKKVAIPEISSTYQMVQQGGVIFRGRVSVENGKFKSNFIVPKDISYENKNGKIMSYLFNDETDGIGFTDMITVGGTDTTSKNDGLGPEISIYYDDYNFESSYLVNQDFTLLVKLKDETGLNTTGTGVGHRLEAVLNGDRENPIDLTNFFIGDINAGGKSGEIKYRFSNLEAGDYSISVNAWDVFNNKTITSSNFTVVNTSKAVMKEVVNYPNPFSGNTTFTFQRNDSRPINIKIKIYTITGRKINEIEDFSTEKFVKINWDGRDADGDLAGNGTYFYKVILNPLDGSESINTLGKLSIIR